MTYEKDNPDQQKRIANLRSELESLGGHFTVTSEIPADLEEHFLRQVLEYEKAKPITLLQLLNNAGLAVPPPNSLDDTEISTKLWEVIQRMASFGAYLLNTNHLSDPVLYKYLYNEWLREDVMLFPENPAYAYVIDLTGGGSDEDMQTFLKYYADQGYRQRWARDWPNDPMPEHEDPPFDRDRHLPKSPLR